MGKSYKKFPILHQEKKDDCHKLNRQIRHMKLEDEIPGHAAYKKIASGHRGWSYIWTKEQAIQEYNQYEHIRKRYKTLDDWLNYWKSCVVRK